MAQTVATTQPEPIEHLVKLKADGVRLDQYLAQVYQDYSRSVIRRAIARRIALGVTGWRPGVDPSASVWAT